MSLLQKIESMTESQRQKLMGQIQKLPKSEAEMVLEILEELEDRKATQKARDSLIEFCLYMNPDYKVGKHHKDLAAILQDMAYGRKFRTAVNIAPRFGKLIADETPVMTPTGWTTHGDLQPGDYVFHPSGYPVKVVAVSDKGPADIKMTFGTGQSKESIYCHENHEWMMYQMSGKTWKVRETKEFLGEKALKYLKPGKRKGLQRAGYQLPNVEPLVTCEKHLPMHPYAFGVWLGDGTTGKPCVTHHVDDTAHLQKIQNMGYKVSAVFNQVSENTKTTSFGGPRPGVASQFRKDLEATGAFKNKHIPEVYKLGSIEQRLELLAGLVDTDGYCDPNGRVFIGTVCPTLADDIADVVSSFGWRPYRVTVPPTTSSSGIVGRRDTLYVGFNPTLPLPVAIERKQNTRFGVRRKVGLWGVERDPAGKVGKCIQVDSPDGLYLVGKTLIPTHNSHMTSEFFPAWFIGHFPQKKIMMVSHTAELAVDFGRKVRNIVASPQYARVFPGVELSKDSKSAGRWNTNKGGEYFACISPETVVKTPQGEKRAGDVVVGDQLLNAGAPVTVQRVYNSEHSATFTIQGVEFSAKHPVWTMNRGWVYAENILPSDVLCVGSIYDSLKAKLDGVKHGYLEHTDVPPVVQHKKSMREPTQREVQELWRPRHILVRALAEVRQLFSRYGDTTFQAAYCGPGRQRRALLAGELPVGDARATGEQQADKRAYRWENDGAASKTAGDYPRSSGVQDESWDGPVGQNQETQEELRAYSSPEGLGWMRDKAAQFLAGGSSAVREPQSGVKRYLARVGWATQKLQGLLLGVRRAGTVVKAEHEPRPFVNFLTDGDHTFYAGGVLTHNCGVGGALAGRGADLLVIDDPHNEQEILNGNLEIFERAYEWYAYGARTRLMPGGAVALVMCMTGDTPVLMADGAEKRLDKIKIGDKVATYEDGQVTTTTVKNWKCSGSDYVYKIRTTCGRVIRANERHPFLVDRSGDLLWVRLKALKPGDTLVSLKDVTASGEQRQSLASARGVNPEIYTTGKTPTPPIFHSGTTGNGKVRAALSESVITQRTFMDYVKSTTIRSITRKIDIRKLRSIGERSELKAGMESPFMLMSACSLSKMASAQFAGSLPVTMLEPIGAANYASTTATTQTKLEHFYATTATSQLGTQKHQKPQKKSLNTYGVTRTQIASIEYDCIELVYDVTIERTENFIANGVVSHNTRWAQNDLTGSIVQDMVRKPDADQWEVVEFPALLERPNAPYDAAPKDKYLSLWPEFWDVEDLLRTKESMPSFQWNAQYMQQPTSKESAIIKPDWWQKWTKADPPPCEYIIMALDAAAEKNNRADFTSLSTWGVFYFDDKDTGEKKAGIILLDAIKERLEFPELKRLALTEYKNWQADWFVVEKKSSGTPLYQELRRIGIPVQEFTPHRGTGDKTARLNSISDIFASGHVWYPHGIRWAEELVDEVCGFPNMANDDQVDTCIMALMRFRLGGFISLASDDWDEDDYEPRRAAYY